MMRSNAAGLVQLFHNNVVQRLEDVLEAVRTGGVGDEGIDLLVLVHHSLEELVLDEGCAGVKVIGT
jgi:hypothetical protein